MILEGELKLLSYYLERRKNNILLGDRDNYVLLDLHYIIDLAIELGLAQRGTRASSNTETSDEEVVFAPDPNGTMVNTIPRWTVNVQSAENLQDLPLKQPHSGNYNWLGPEQTGSPKYLWDSQTSQTVLATPDVLREGYIAVSYTWGRFKEGYGSANGTQWKVPIIKPDICPDMLDKLKDIMVRIPASRYFWVDVLCINQDDMSQKKEEIAKQAAIFGNAKGCLAYLWTLESEDELAHIMASFGEQLMWSLTMTSPQNRRQSELDACRRLPPDIQEKLDGKLRLDPWFTSLWALQEMVLAPAQIWITRTGSFCSVNGSLVTTLFMAKALSVLNWAFRLRRQLWTYAMMPDFPRLTQAEASAASYDICA